MPSSLHVLLVEDNPDHADLIQGYVALQPNRGKSPHVAWTWVTTLMAAFDAIDTATAAFDVILLDLRLPDSDITDTLPRMVRKAEHLPIIVLTSLNDLDLAHTAVQGGAQDYLVKSELSSDLLVRTIQYAYERKRYAAELQRSNRELQQFANTLAHEIRSPLSGVAFCFDRLQRRYHDTFDERTSTLVGHGQAAVADVMRLVEGLLSFARASSGHRNDAIDTSAMVDDVIAQVRHVPAFAHADLSRGELPDIVADAEGLPHLFRNLIMNGLKYNDADQPQICLRGEETDEGWLFCVEDNGVGVAPEDTERIFGLFERADATPEGSGIGLAFCKRIVERHGGRIWVESERGAGSRFYFTLLFRREGGEPLSAGRDTRNSPTARWLPSASRFPTPTPISVAVFPVNLLLAKRDGEALSRADLQRLITAYLADEVADYQMSAFLMAAFLQGMNTEETQALTDALLHSGTVLDLSATPGVKVDKHSTGGVGDKVSLILAPLVAACGVPVPMISGRGLGHTGGTLDKLESISGFDVNLSIAEYKRQLDALGVVMIGQTDEIAPADRALYALRDVTATVEFIPFIAASIMSKKLAEGIDALVLDVKCGKGAFMKSDTQARKLAETLVQIGADFGKDTVALLTAMDAPLGRGVGNWPEVAESVRCLRGETDGAEDVMEVTLALAGEMICLGGQADTPEAGRARAEAAIADGSAFAKFAALVEAQGGDPGVLDAPDKRGHEGIPVHAPDDANGVVTALDALAMGQLAVALGAGRMRKEDDVDPLAGLTLNKKPGAPVGPGDVLAYLHTTRTTDLDTHADALRAAYRFGPTAEAPQALVRDRLSVRDGALVWESAN